MKKLLVVLLLSGCTMIPSKWDLNQAHSITDIKQQIDTIDCRKDMVTHINVLEQQVQWLHFYSEYKGTKDIDLMVKILDTNVKEFQARATLPPMNPAYCELKKGILLHQADIIGNTMKGSLK